MLLLYIVLGCTEAPAPAQPTAPALTTRTAPYAPLDARLDFARITPTPAQPPPAALPQIPTTLEATVSLSVEQQARLRQGICGGDPAVLAALSKSWNTSTVPTRFLIQPWADVVSTCTAPRSCYWATQQPEGRLSELAHAVSARCLNYDEPPWWLAPQAPALAVIRHYQPPNAGTDRWRVPYHVRWSRALSHRITQLGAQAGSDPDVRTGLQRLAGHPDPEARAAAERLQAQLPAGFPVIAAQPAVIARADDCVPALTSPQLLPPATTSAKEQCWLALLRDNRPLAVQQAPLLIHRSTHGSTLIAQDAAALRHSPTRAALADDLRGAGLLDTRVFVPKGTAWTRAEHLLNDLGYITTLPTTVQHWPRGLDLILGSLVGLPGSDIADTLFIEEEDGVLQAFADGLRWEVSALDDNSAVQASGITGFLNTIARDRGSQTRFLLLEGGRQVIAGPVHGLQTALSRGWLSAATPDALPPSQTPSSRERE